ncbi:unnamed protein product [Mucor hiemalis]
MLLAKLIQTSRVLDDDHLLKLARHSQWAKRHKKRVKEKRKQLLKRNENWIKETQWKVTIAPLATTAEKEVKDNIEENKIKSKCSRLNELSRILTKLKQLRDLRRKKLEAKGHFFAEDGNQFFNQVQRSHESNEIEQEQKDISVNLIKPEKLVLHSEDTWRNIPIDKKAYSYWCQSDQSLEALLLNRRLWDQYIIHDSRNNDLIHKVPPTFVDPAPPANWIWASYLG